MSKKKKQQQANAAAAAAGGWLMTYADLMALLMAFFVMLLAMAEVDKSKFEELGRSMKEALGTPIREIVGHSSDQFKPFKDTTKTGQSTLDKEMERVAKMKATQKDAEEIKKVLEKQINNEQIEVDTHGQIIVIRILESGVFKSGKAEIQQSFRPALSKLSNELKAIKGDIVVSGHADDIPIENEFFSSNWELSAGRAYSVIDSLLDDSVLDANRFVLRGFGSARPLVPNTNAENRAKNRRVEIMIDQRDAETKNSDMTKDESMRDMPITVGDSAADGDSVADADTVADSDTVAGGDSVADGSSEGAVTIDSDDGVKTVALDSSGVEDAEGDMLGM